MSPKTRDVDEDFAEEGGRFTSEIAALKAEILRLARRLGEDEEAMAARIRSLAGDAASEFRRVEGDIAAATRVHPWKWLGIAAILGMAVGLILRR